LLKDYINQDEQML